MYQLTLKIIVSICFIFIGLYLAVQYKITSNLDDLTNKAHAVVDFNYGDVELTLMGKVLIRNSRIKLPDQNLAITVEEVTIAYSFDTLLDFLFSSSFFSNSRLPESLEFSYKGATIALTPSVVDLLTSIDQPNIISALESSACGDKSHLGIHEYLAMGYENITLSGGFNMDREAVVGDLISNVNGFLWLEIDAISRVEVNVKLSDFLNDYKEIAKLELIPTIEQLDINITDMGYHNHKSNYCSSQSNVSIVEYVDNHVNLVSEAFMTAGLIMTPELQAVYREILQPGSQIHVTIKPQIGVQYSLLERYNEQELRDILGLEIAVNNLTLPPLFEGWTIEKFNNIFVKPPSSHFSHNNFFTLSYKLKPMTKVSSYINSNVKVYRDDGQIFEGVLARVDDDILDVKMTIKNGTAQVPLQKNRINRFYVYQ